MYPNLYKEIIQIDYQNVCETRKPILQPLIDFIQIKSKEDQNINLNFICTHNSRRSHFAQIWAQTAAHYFGVKNVFCYSGGTEETALYSQVSSTLQDLGFNIMKIAGGDNSIYAIKYAANAQPIIGFSKKYNHSFNPISDFAAVLTCSHADKGCPFVVGASARIAMTFEDPKHSDNLPNQAEVYRKKSLEIAKEIFYIFSKVAEDAN